MEKVTAIFFFQLKNNYTGEKRFTLVLRKLDGSPVKNFLKEVLIEFLLNPDQTEEKKRYEKLSVRDILIVLGIQNLIQLTTLNPVFIDSSTSLLYTSFVDKYPPETFMYRFRLRSITISTSMENMETEILLAFTDLNNCKKADINGTREDILVIIHTENIVNWAHLKNASSWINIGLMDDINIQEPANTLFCFLTESIQPYF